MMKQIVWLTGCLMLSACSLPSFSIVPEIGVESVVIQPKTVTDSISPDPINDRDLIFRLSYQDGDGDLGKTQEEINIDGSDTTKQNFNVKVYRLNNGFPQLTNVKIFASFKTLVTDNRKRPIKGILQYTYSNFNYLLPEFSKFRKGDTLQFEIFIRDQANHQSNVVNPQLVLK
jgi:hypothetical protein